MAVALLLSGIVWTVVYAITDASAFLVLSLICALGALAFALVDWTAER